MVEFRTDKEVLQIMSNCVDFVCELIEYIAEYPDDDYMTMECLCRKLVKHGLLDKADGYYQTHEIRTNTHECVKDTHDKTEPQTEEPSFTATDFGKGTITRYTDEPQTETEIAKAIVHKMIDDAVIAEDAYPDLRQKMHDAVERLDEYYPSEDERSE